jgi:DNA helicase-2/ATP-dependent DNA helicase PcrA
VAAWTDEVDKLLAERARLREAAAGAVEVTLPAHLSVSQLVALHRSPEELARWIRRPVPLPPAPLARRGTAFHVWLEGRFRGGRLLDIEELPGAADADAGIDGDLDLLKEAFLASEWAQRQPIEVEVSFETLLDDVLVRGRADAVFRDAGRGTGARHDIVVDWKTGRVPAGEDAHAAAVQLAAYRLAWHRLSGTPLERISAAFHYVRAGVTIRPVDLLDADGLVDLVRRVPIAQDIDA